MPEQDLIQQGNNLMLFGMGTVFVFLSLLVLCTSLMSALINRFFPEAEKPVKQLAKTRKDKNGDVDADVLKAIQLAIGKHRAKQ